MNETNVLKFPASKPLTPGRVLANVRAQMPLCVVCVFVDSQGELQLASCEQDDHYTLGLLQRAIHRIQRLLDHCEGKW